MELAPRAPLPSIHFFRKKDTIWKLPSFFIRHATCYHKLPLSESCPLSEHAFGSLRNYRRVTYRVSGKFLSLFALAKFNRLFLAKHETFLNLVSFQLNAAAWSMFPGTISPAKDVSNLDITVPGKFNGFNGWVLLSDNFVLKRPFTNLLDIILWRE